MAQDVTYLGPSPSRYCEAIETLLVKDVAVEVSDTAGAAIQDLEDRGVATIAPA